MAVRRKAKVKMLTAMPPPSTTMVIRVKSGVLARRRTA